eukprot:TRINITY_DN7882_c0_g1_i1.p1 TRINITY_DN7882_c0_g1~~TRINITY_DN7882_c0_g1_i1.p1  ORF type:complete len:174 (+),score=10.93 TRINITY_DN7882_c0_g1_i1:45-566(+)
MVNLALLERKIKRAGSVPTHVWWDGPQDVAARRQLSEIDPYHVHDRDGVTQKCSDKRFLRAGAAPSPADAFAPSPKEMFWGKKIPPRFAEGPKRPSSASKLDPYEMYSKNQIGTNDRSRRQEFGRPSSASRVTYRVFDRDFTKSGALARCDIIRDRRPRPSSAPSNFGGRRYV